MFQPKAAPFRIPKIKVFRLWPVRLARTETALKLAAELMAKTGYLPNKRERGIVQWKRKKDSDHNCFIWFRSYRGIHLNGYIGVDTCECKKPQPLKEIVDAFEKEMHQHELFTPLAEQLFNNVGTS